MTWLERAEKIAALGLPYHHMANVCRHACPCDCHGSSWCDATFAEAGFRRRSEHQQVCGHGLNGENLPVVLGAAGVADEQKTWRSASGKASSCGETETTDWQSFLARRCQRSICSETMALPCWCCRRRQSCDRTSSTKRQTCCCSCSCCLHPAARPSKHDQSPRPRLETHKAWCCWAYPQVPSSLVLEKSGGDLGFDVGRIGCCCCWCFVGGKAKRGPWCLSCRQCSRSGEDVTEETW